MNRLYLRLTATHYANISSSILYIIYQSLRHYCAISQKKTKKTINISLKRAGAVYKPLDLALSLIRYTKYLGRRYFISDTQLNVYLIWILLKEKLETKGSGRLLFCLFYFLDFRFGAHHFLLKTFSRPQFEVKCYIRRVSRACIQRPWPFPRKNPTDDAFFVNWCNHMTSA